MGEQPFGFINAFKPPGPTSTALGAWVRRLLGGTAVGHWGTLDPRAAGVLVLAVGRAPRLLPLLHDARKQYVFELALGTRTDTGDASGRVVEAAPPPDDWNRRLVDVLTDFVGDIQQTPPMYSAVKIEGRPLYERARRGAETQRSQKVVHVDALRLIEAGERRARLLVTCSPGTYVRVLCEDIGRRIGCPAHMGALLRTASGPFALEQSKLAGEIAADPFACLIDPLTILPQPRVELDAAEARRFTHGNEVALRDAQLDDAAVEVLALRAGRLLGVAKSKRAAAGVTLAPTRVFRLGAGDQHAGAND